ncbi:Putative protein [Zobellia galactanivorans]|uniref:Uncharacterized protein n=1 Tax=Zobellia galactanivorans (strain DSM 12802 / CCUG 47099 / CIP 106680 / NCIMB 13871 / Dsij) TaxID=63186 RepID=G0L4L2_ZOBGA|nr:Putative protein [Zobellia galactanivorans]
MTLGGKLDSNAIIGVGVKIFLEQGLSPQYLHLTNLFEPEPKVLRIDLTT